jgi:ankyrin repeat protein
VDQESLDDHKEPHTSTNNTTTKLSFLYTLAKQWAWEAVIFRCQTHPHEARADIVDASGDTMLHWTCFGSPPLHVVQALLETCPDLAKVANLQGNLPLHVACSYRASGQIIRTLLQVYPQAAAIPNQAGSYALHLCCDYGSSVDSLLALVETQEGVNSLPRKDGIYQRTPLQILNERKNMVQFHQTLQHVRLCRQRQGIYTLTEERDKKEHARLEALIVQVSHEMEFWNKARLLVLAQNLRRPFTLEDVDRPGIVHACILLHECPPSLREFAILLHVEELLQPDAQGRLPLHLACTNSSSPSVIAEVLRACPKAALILDGHGRLAWSLFQEHHPSSGWSGTVQELVLANPLALETSDLDSRLYPLIWSRFSNPKLLAVLYESIRGNPISFLRR